MKAVSALSSVPTVWKHLVWRSFSLTFTCVSCGEFCLRVRLQTLSYSWWSQVYVDLHKLGWSLGGISKQLQTARSSVQRIVVIHVVIQTCHHFSKVWKKTPTLTLRKEEIGWDVKDHWNKKEPPGKKVDTFKHKWNVWLPTWTSQIPPGGIFYGQRDTDWAVWPQWQDVCLEE